MAIARGVRFILLFMIAAVIVSMTGVAVSYFLLTRGPAVESDSVLWLRIPASLGEQAPDDVLGLLDQRATVGSVVDTLRKAKVDDRVSAVVVVPPSAPGSGERYRRYGPRSPTSRSRASLSSPISNSAWARPTTFRLRVTASS